MCWVLFLLQGCYWTCYGHVLLLSATCGRLAAHSDPPYMDVAQWGGCGNICESYFLLKHPWWNIVACCFGLLWAMAIHKWQHVASMLMVCCTMVGWPGGNSSCSVVSCWYVFVSLNVSVEFILPCHFATGRVGGTMNLSGCYVVFVYLYVSHWFCDVHPLTKQQHHVCGDESSPFTTICN